MKRKRPNPEERRAAREAAEARIRELRRRADQIRGELEASRARRAAE